MTEIEKIMAKWRKEIADYDAAHIDSSDPEDWMAGHRQCLGELEAALTPPPAVDEAIAAMTQAEREEFLGRFCARYCLHCAADDPHCQCWNDE